MNNKNKPNIKWMAGGRALWVIAALLASSGLIRVAFGPGQAIAREVAALTSVPEMHAEGQICKTDDETSAILAALLKREAAVKTRERLLDEKQQSIAFSETEIRKNLDMLEATEKALAATIAAAQTASEDDLARLTSVYESMKAKEASVLFEEMAPEFAAGFVARMRPDAAAQIMSGLEPSTAYSISVILAGRNALTPKN